MMVSAPAWRAAIRALSPTAPQPQTATRQPRPAPATACTAPHPLSTAQPTGETRSSGVSGRTRATCLAGTVITSLKVPSPISGWSGRPVSADQ